MSASDYDTNTIGQSEISNLINESVGAESISSRMIFSYDIPEIKNLNPSFIYNYFTQDERVKTVNNASAQLFDMQLSDTNEIFHLATRKHEF